MACDEKLSQRIRDFLDGMPGLVEKRMFGGVAFLLNGNMTCGIHKEWLVVRVGPDANDRALEKPFTRIFDITGRPMKGWIMIDPEGVVTDDDLEGWVMQGVEFASSLPAKG